MELFRSRLFARSSAENMETRHGSSSSRRGSVGRIFGALGAVGALTLGSAGVILAVPGTASAVNNNPPGNPTSPAISYEEDCTTGFKVGQVAPFSTTLDGNTTIDSGAPTGAVFGFNGTAQTTIVGGFVAAVYAQGLGENPLTLQWVETIGSTDGHATGSYKMTTPTLSKADGGGSVLKATWTSGSTTLTGNFSGAAVGDGVATGSPVGIPAAATITAINGTSSATISLATTAASTAATLVGYGAATSFSHAVSTGNVFTTKGTNGAQAGVGINSTSPTSFTLEGFVAFGGAAGVGTSNCLLTGYDASSKPGPVQTGGLTPPFPTTPVLPAGSTTALVSVSPVQAPPAAYVNLVSATTVPGAPTGATATAGNAKATVTWTAPASNGGSPITGYTVTSAPGGKTCTTTGATTCDVSGLTNGQAYTFTVTATNAIGTGAASAASNSVTPVESGPAQVNGYWTVTSVGAVFSNGAASLYGDPSSLVLRSPIVGFAPTPDGKGYWLVGSDGGIFAYGDAGFHGSMGGSHLNAPIVSMAATADGKGYWLVASDGGVFAFGDAAFHGSMGGSHLNAPIVGIASNGTGYWLVASDGGIFAYGAGFFGSTGGSHLNAPIVGMSQAAGGTGYWLVASDGGVFAFGTANFQGSAASLHLRSPIVSITSSGSGGYVLGSADGGIFAYGSTFYGSQFNTALRAPVIAVVS